MPILFLCIIFFLFFIFTVVTYFYLQGPPFVPSDDESIHIISEFIQKYKPKKILEMGSGDGRLVLSLASKGYLVDGVDLNPWLVLRSRKRLKKVLPKYKGKIMLRDFWQFDVGDYDMVILYLANPFMKRVEKKMKKELRSGSYVISNFAIFPVTKPIIRKKRVVVYKI